MARRVRKNRFAGADAVYSTKKYYVREDVSPAKNGAFSVSKRYIRKSPKARRELQAVWGPLA